MSLLTFIAKAAIPGAGPGLTALSIVKSINPLYVLAFAAVAVPTGYALWERLDVSHAQAGEMQAKAALKLDQAARASDDQVWATADKINHTSIDELVAAITYQSGQVLKLSRAGQIAIARNERHVAAFSSSIAVLKAQVAADLAKPIAGQTPCEKMNNEDRLFLESLK